MLKLCPKESRDWVVRVALDVVPSQVVDRLRASGLGLGCLTSQPRTEALVVKPKRRLSAYGRWLLVQRVRVEQWSAAAAAEPMGVSRATTHKWLARFDAQGAQGAEGLEDRFEPSPAQPGD